MLDTKIRTSRTRKIPNQFPFFKPFLPEDHEMYIRFVAQFPQHCDFTLNNMLVWIANGDSLEYSWIHHNLVLRINSSLFLGTSTEPWYTVIGNRNPDRTLYEIFRHLPIDSLKFVPDYFVTGLQRPHLYAITEDDSNRDYIISIKKLLKKEGKEYEGFRYQVKYFLKKYSEEAIIRPLDLSTSDAVKELVNALHSWPSVTSFTPEGNDPERRDAVAIDKLLSMQSRLLVKHQALGIYIHNALQGFSIYHIPPANQSIAMGNHIKFNAEYQRMFDFLVYATASNLNSQNIELLNAEQDMGIPGIKHHKMALGPVDFYRKYTIVRS
jgi:hypothetical protein